ncbi:hypothetical protein WN944_019670 [Citrus x changshan-huyou]|uniref:ATPase V1 complex subunit H C-terminal domain-containing protein n=1 Tax=Citrus x changshan-huyou TaxID=2935761 RepID=A0AAP0QGL1_9ROSI
MEYKEKFELLLGRLWGIPEAVLEGNFMKGLKPEIRASLRLLRPRGLGESMELAQLVEDKNTVERVNRSNSVNFSYQNSTPLRDSQRDWDSGARLGVTFERLMETEIQDKRAKKKAGKKLKKKTHQFPRFYLEDNVSFWEESNDLLEGLNQLEEGLKDNTKRLSSFDKYMQEVLLGHLDWSPMHKDPLSWRDNITNFEENDFQYEYTVGGTIVCILKKAHLW